jgi:hypothetical protein
MLQRFAAMGVGGVLAGTQAAINDSWPKAHGFLHRNLDAGDDVAASSRPAPPSSKTGARYSAGSSTSSISSASSASE